MRQRGLQALLVRRVALASAALLVVFNIVMGALIHHHIHRQVDLLLLHLARAEAHMSVTERAHGLQVHSAQISVSAMGEPLSKHALALDGRCEVLSATPELKSLRALPAPWCTPAQAAGYERAFFMDDVAGLDLRVASTTIALEDGALVTFLVGVDHHKIDASTWTLVRWSLVASLLIIASLVVMVWTIARGLTRELRRLERACESLSLAQRELGEGEGQLARRFEINPNAPQELQALSTTLGQLNGALSALLNAQDHFIAEAAHELRTPLAALRGELEVTLRRERTAAQYREAIAWVMADVERLTSLANDLLDLASAKLQREPALRALSAEALLEEGLTRLSRAAQPLRVTLTWQAGARQAQVSGDPQRTARAMENLASNAALHARATTLRAHVRLSAGMLELELWDDGVGIEPTLVPRLLLPFQRGEAAARTQGHGLGLSITAQLMSAQGATLSFAPRQSGTCWLLRWALTDASDQALQHDTAPPSDARGPTTEP